MKDDTDELDLVRRAVEGDAAALTVLLTDTEARLRTHLCRRIPTALRGSFDVDDIVQEAQIQAFRHIGDFMPRGPESFYRWVSTIALRRLRNAIKRQRAVKRGGDRAQVRGAGAMESSVVALLDLMAGPEKTPSRAAASHEAVEATREALTQLPRDYQQAVQLVYLDGLPVAEVAAIMGRTERAIHNLCYKAKARLRESLGSGSRFLSQSG